MNAMPYSLILLERQHQTFPLHRYMLYVMADMCEDRITVRMVLP